MPFSPRVCVVHVLSKPSARIEEESSGTVGEQAYTAREGKE